MIRLIDITYEDIEMGDRGCRIVVQLLHLKFD